MSSELLQPITDALVSGEIEQTVEATARALASALEPMTILNEGLLPGMRTVGERFATGEYFLPHLIVAAKAMREAMKLIEPELRARHQVRQSPGTVVIGTVKGDIHEIGKSLVGTMLSAHGFEVHDLGVDVPVDRFVSVVRDTGAQVLGMSALLTTTMSVQRTVIAALDAAGLRSRVKVMVGGAPVTERWARDIGADGYADDAVAAVALAERLAADAGV